MTLFLLGMVFPLHDIHKQGGRDEEVNEYVSDWFRYRSIECLFEHRISGKRRGSIPILRQHVLLRISKLLQRLSVLQSADNRQPGDRGTRTKSESRKEQDE